MREATHVVIRYHLWSYVVNRSHSRQSAGRGTGRSKRFRELDAIGVAPSYARYPLPELPYFLRSSVFSTLPIGLRGSSSTNAKYVGAL